MVFGQCRYPAILEFGSDLKIVTHLMLSMAIITEMKIIGEYYDHEKTTASRTAD